MYFGRWIQIRFQNFTFLYHPYPSRCIILWESTSLCTSIWVTDMCKCLLCVEISETMAGRKCVTTNKYKAFSSVVYRNFVDKTKDYTPYLSSVIVVIFWTLIQIRFQNITFLYHPYISRCIILCESTSLRMWVTDMCNCLLCAEI